MLLVYNPNTKILEKLNSNMFNWVIYISFDTTSSTGNLNTTNLNWKLDKNEDGLIQSNPSIVLHFEGETTTNSNYTELSYEELEFWNVAIPHLQQGYYFFPEPIDNSYVVTKQEITNCKVEMIDYTKSTDNTIANVSNIVTCVCAILITLILAASSICFFISRKKVRS